MDALRLLANDCECFHCEHCSGELAVEIDAKIASQEPGNGGDDDNSTRRKRRRIEKLGDMQRRMDEQLEPFQAQIQTVEVLAIPKFKSLPSWLGAAAVVPCGGETEVEVGILLSGAVYIDDDKKMNSSEEKKKRVLKCKDEDVDEEVEIEWEDG
uniref:Uncharacterized protein n=1 Tax=Aegilops tauschii TaxID=37682 RepID=M8CMS1_AEGTA